MSDSGTAPDRPTDRPAEDDVQVRRDDSRYVATLGGEEVGAAYVREVDGRTVFTHTEVDQDVEGHGVGSTLVRFALDDARSRGLRAVAQCPFVAAYVQRHPEYADVVDPE